MKWKGFCLMAIVLFLVGCSADRGSFDVQEGGTSGSITRFVVHNSFMYVLNPNEVQTFDVSDSANPVLVNQLETDYGLETILIYKEKIYLGSRTALYILGIDNPAEPQILSQTDREAAFFNGCDPVAVKDAYAYSTIKIIQNVCGNVGAESALLVYDVSDAEAPDLLSTHFLDLPNGLSYVGDFLFVCDAGQQALICFDISDPFAVQRVEDFDIAIVEPVDLIVDGDRMIVSTISDFKILDISDLSNVQIVGEIDK